MSIGKCLAEIRGKIDENPCSKVIFPIGQRLVLDDLIKPFEIGRLAENEILFDAYSGDLEVAVHIQIGQQSAKVVGGPLVVGFNAVPILHARPLLGSQCFLQGINATGPLFRIIQLSFLEEGGEHSDICLLKPLGALVIHGVIVAIWEAQTALSEIHGVAGGRFGILIDVGTQGMGNAPSSSPGPDFGEGFLAIQPINGCQHLRYGFQALSLNTVFINKASIKISNFLCV